jgi:hypothetical protein
VTPLCEYTVAHGVNPAVKRMESVPFEPSLDRPHADSRAKQLRTTDDPILSAGKRRDHLVRGKVAYFTPYTGVNEARLAHEPDRDPQTATEHPPSMPKFARTLDKISYLTQHLINQWIN